MILYKRQHNKKQNTEKWAFSVIYSSTKWCFCWSDCCTV